MERKEAIEVVKKNYPHVNVSGSQFETALRTLIPELKESEDEKIKQLLLRFVKYDMSDNYSDDFTPADCVAWLEKQGEQNLAFIEKGKWYVCIRTSYKPNGKDFIEGKTYYAKEDYKIIGECGEVDIATDNPEEFFRSATEEETNDIIKNFVNEQKPAWSEEDENTINNICHFIQGHTNFAEEAKEDAVRFLKSIKDRVLPQPQREWNEEDKEQLDRALYMMEQLDMTKSWDDVYNWLKSLRPQTRSISDDELAQAKKDAYNSALDKIEYHSGEPTFDEGWSAAIDFVRKKSLRPQSHWKPSEEQMKTLNEVINYCANGKEAYLNDYIYNRLIDLRDELNKL